MRRKEAKSYGTKKLIEGEFEPGNVCIIVDDVVSTGSSLLETIAVSWFGLLTRCRRSDINDSSHSKDVESVGLVVKDVIAVVDREEGGVQNLASRGYRVHCLYTLDMVTQIKKWHFGALIIHLRMTARFQILKVFTKSKLIANDIVAKIRNQEANTEKQSSLLTFLPTLNTRSSK